MGSGIDGRCEHYLATTSAEEGLYEDITAGNASEISKDERHYVEAIDIYAWLWWSNAVCLPLIALIGVLCNGLNLLVLTTNASARRLPSWHLLVALAVFDTLFLVFATMEVTPTSIGALSMDKAPGFSAMHTRMALYIRMLASTFYKASIMIVIAFNVERYLCVCRAYMAHGLCTERNNRLAVALSVLIGLLCSLQWPIAYEVVECWPSPTDERTYHFIDLRQSEGLRLYYRCMDYVSLVGFNLAPIVLLSVLNARLVIALRRVVEEDLSRRSSADATQHALHHHPSTQNGAHMTLFTSSESSSQRLNANAMLFAVVLLLFVCIGPQAPARLLYDYYGDYNHPTAVLYTCVSQQLVFLNASLNFCLYCLVSRRYRAMLAESVGRAVARARARLLRAKEARDGRRGSYHAGAPVKLSSLLASNHHERDDPHEVNLPILMK